MEREYNIPLRKEFLKVQRYKRTNKAVKAVKEFISKHMKSDDVRIGKHLNMKLWEHGIKNPPHHVKVLAKKDDEGIVRVELVGAPVEEKSEVQKKKFGAKLRDMVAGKKSEKPAENKEKKSPAKEAPGAELSDNEPGEAAEAEGAEDSGDKKPA
ncbi:60S ribosomal protein L31 [Candidatus Woesearchaeota archaeon]|nr:60S ribosomal protein L31 [Candidatus Woesearchaeota archaeon]